MLADLGANATDWQPAICQDASGATVTCKYSASLAEAWPDGCDPNASHAAGTCETAGGGPGSNPAIVSVSAFASGSLLTPASPPLGSPVNTTAVSAPTACTESYISGVCDLYLYLAGAAVAAWFFMRKKGGAYAR